MDERIAALDHLELLVESADNANGNYCAAVHYYNFRYFLDLKALKLWEPLLKKGLYDPEESIREMTFWIIGTCLQNNPTAFSHFSAMNGFNELVLSVIKTEPQPVQVLKKWIYAISGCIQENMTFEILSSFFVDGPAFLVSLLEDERTKASVDGEANADSDLFYKIIYLVKKFIQKIPSSEEYFNEILSKYPLECK